MPDPTRPFLTVPLAFLTLLAAVGTTPPEPLPRGEIIPKVVCAADAEETYALYLPTSYDPAKPRPILYLLDAKRRGAMAAERFREAAETYGWILASSNNSESDGPFTPNIRAMRAMWADTQGRVAIDPRRVYVSGFSGGARAACMLAQTGVKGRRPEICRSSSSARSAIGTSTTGKCGGSTRRWPRLGRRIASPSSTGRTIGRRRPRAPGPSSGWSSRP
jgi:hypothetical protein